MFRLDTDVLIDVQRGHPPAVAWFAGLTHLPSVPGLVVMELIQDARNLQEVRAALNLVSPLPIVWPTTADCNRALADFAAYHVSQNVGLLDALIAACAVGLSAVQTPLMAEVRVKDDEVQVDVGRRVDKKVSPPPPGGGQGVRAGASVDASADEAVIAGSFTCADRPHPNPLPEGEGTTTQQIAATPRPSDALVELARSSSEFRRRAASVAQSGPVQEVRGDLYHLERQSRSGLSVRPPASSGCPTLASECSATWWLAAKP